MHIVDALQKTLHGGWRNRKIDVPSDSRFRHFARAQPIALAVVLPMTRFHVRALV